MSGVRAAVGSARSDGARVSLVPTMGALHDGHLELVCAARERVGDEGLVVVSIFVNPTQFGPGEDFASYPRDLEADEASLGALRAPPDVVYAPTVEEMYPRETQTTISVAGLADRLCGAARPEHFNGVCTVVAKLLHQVGPDVALFGRKDYQQLLVISRMVADLDIPVEIEPVATVRESDGLAMSSRNAYLDAAERRAAAVIPRALAAAVRAARSERGAGRPVAPEVLRSAAGATISAEPRAQAEYVEAVDAETLASLEGPVTDRGEDGRVLVAVAVRIGSARLIDNVVVGDEADEERLLAYD